MAYQYPYNVYDEKMLSIKAYKGESYGDINTALRESSGNLEQIGTSIRKHIENIDSLMKEGPEERILYRGIQGLPFFLDTSNKIGSNPILIQLAFSSATRNIKVTRSFVDKNGCCVLAFPLTSDIKRYDFGDKQEEEVLLQRNIQFILESDIPEIDVKNKIQIYKAIVKPYNPPKITQQDFNMLGNLIEEIDEKINLENIEEIYEELKESSFDSAITEDDINMYIDDHRYWSETKKKQVKSKLLEMIKNDY
jgi:hypothetical protein